MEMNTVSSKEAHSDVEDIKTISAAILYAREALEIANANESDDSDSDETPLRESFDALASLIHEFCMRGIMPKKNGTPLQRRLGQLISIANDFHDTFDLPHRNSPEGATVRAAIGAYQLGLEDTANKGPGTSKPQPATPALKRPEKRKASEVGRGDGVSQTESQTKKKSKEKMHSRDCSSSTTTSSTHDPIDAILDPPASGPSSVPAAGPRFSPYISPLKQRLRG